MQAAIVPHYGSPEVIRLETRPKPQPKPGEVLVRIEASTVTTADWRLRAAAYPKGMGLIGRMVSGLRRPRHEIPGVTFSGTVVACGDGAGRFGPGDAVFGIVDGGAHADYIALPETGAIALKPARLTHAQAASLPFGAATAHHFLVTLGKVQPGERVLVTGASGAVGHAGVQIAKALGAHVTALASARNGDFLRSLGADVVLAYETADIAAQGLRFDAILDCIAHFDFARARPLLRRKGRLLVVEGGLRTMAQLLVPWRAQGHALRFGVSLPKAQDLGEIAGLAQSGAIDPVIECSYRLDQIAKAHAALETRHRRGVIALVLRPEAASLAA